MNERIVKNPNFKNNGEFHKSLAARGAGAKDWPNSHTEVEHLGGGKFAASLSSGHRVFFDKADGNKPKKHKLTDERPGKDYVLVQGAKCCVEVYPYYAKYYDVQHEEVRLHEERWVVQRLFKAPDTWRDVDAYNPQIAVEEYSEPAGDVVKVIVIYDTDYGILTIEYFQRDGNALKHNVAFKNTSGSTETFRVVQRWAGIAGNKVKTRQDEYDITTRKILAGLDFTFGIEESPFGIQESLRSMYNGVDFRRDLEQAEREVQGACNQCADCCNHLHHCQYFNPDLSDKCEIHIDKAVQQWKPAEETFDKWLKRKDKRCICCFHIQSITPQQYELMPNCSFSFAPKTLTEETKIPNSLLRPVAIDIHAQGMKADFVYGDWTLAQGETLQIDPDTATLDNPTEDGYLQRYGTSEGACATGSLTRFAAGDFVAYGGGFIPKDTYYGYRGYVEWPISTLAGATLTANPVFKYHGTVADAVEGEINPLTEGAPSGATDANLWDYIASGTAYVDPFTLVIGTGQSQDLGASARTDLQTAMTAEQSWFAIGFQSPGDECSTDDNDSLFITEDKTDAADPKPTLYVEYTPAAPPAGLENKSANMAAKMIAGKLI